MLKVQLKLSFSNFEYPKGDKTMTDVLYKDIKTPSNQNSKPKGKEKIQCVHFIRGVELTPCIFPNFIKLIELN